MEALYWALQSKVAEMVSRIEKLVQQSGLVLRDGYGPYTCTRQGLTR